MKSKYIKLKLKLNSLIRTTTGLTRTYICLTRTFNVLTELAVSHTARSFLKLRDLKFITRNLRVVYSEITNLRYLITRKEVRM